MKQTAVEWLEEALIGHLDISERYKKELFKRAKEMEKEQIINAFNYGQVDLGMEADEYYNNYFKSE